MPLQGAITWSAAAGPAASAGTGAGRAGGRPGSSCKPLPAAGSVAVLTSMAACGGCRAGDAQPASAAGAGSATLCRLAPILPPSARCVVGPFLAAAFARLVVQPATAESRDSLAQYSATEPGQLRLSIQRGCLHAIAKFSRHSAAGAASFRLPVEHLTSGCKRTCVVAWVAALPLRNIKCIIASCSPLLNHILCHLHLRGGALPRDCSSLPQVDACHSLARTDLADFAARAALLCPVSMRHAHPGPSTIRWIARCWRALTSGSVSWTPYKPC